MYIQITNICNMTCEHCGYACTNVGEHMSMKVFKKAIALANTKEDWVNLGGGEPTLHPKFTQFLWYAMLEIECDEVPIWLATNGSNEALTLKLLKLSKAGAISCEVSLDNWHDAISPKVKHLAEIYKMVRSVREDAIVPIGRAKHFPPQKYKSCFCDDLFVNPNGDIYPCGCRITKIGNVLDKHLQLDDKYWNHECERSINV